MLAAERRVAEGQLVGPDTFASPVSPWCPGLGSAVPSISCLCGNASALSAMLRIGQSGLSGEIGGPIVHQSPPPFRQVRPRVGGLDLVLNNVGQRRLDDLAGVVGLLGGPVPEA